MWDCNDLLIMLLTEYSDDVKYVDNVAYSDDVEYVDSVTYSEQKVSPPPHL